MSLWSFTGERHLLKAAEVLYVSAGRKPASTVVAKLIWHGRQTYVLGKALGCLSERWSRFENLQQAHDFGVDHGMTFVTPGGLTVAQLREQGVTP